MIAVLGSMVAGALLVIAYEFYIDGTFKYWWRNRKKK